MRTPSKQEKELAIALAKIVNKVVPELVEKAGASTFEISLEKDEHGVGITIDLDYKEDMIHRGLTPEEMKETWGVVASKALKDNNGNHIVLPHDNEENDLDVLVNNKNSIIIEKKKGKLLAIKGLKDYIVIDTDDVLLICPRVDNPLKELMSKLAMPRYDKFR